MSEVLRITVATSDEMEGLGHRIGAVLRAGDLVVLRGELGAGKTTLTRGIGDGMGVRGPITSPTFVLSRVHPPVAGEVPLVHVDAYRLAGARELDDLDLDFAGAATVVEWGDGLLDGVSDSWLRITIDRPHGAATSTAGPGDDVLDSIADDSPREVELAGFGPAWPASRVAPLVGGGAS